MQGGLAVVQRYLCRAGRKGPILDDLIKARNWLDRTIRFAEKHRGHVEL